MATHELFAYLCVADAARAIDFYRRAFGATEKFRLVEPGGRIGHAEVDFDGTILWNGTPTGMAALESYFRQESQLEPQAEIHLRPDRRAKYDVVANVLASAQRNRMVKIGFVNITQYRD